MSNLYRVKKSNLCRKNTSNLSRVTKSNLHIKNKSILCRKNRSNLSRVTKSNLFIKNKSNLCRKNSFNLCTVNKSNICLRTSPTSIQRTETPEINCIDPILTSARASIFERDFLCWVARVSLSEVTCFINSFTSVSLCDRLVRIFSLSSITLVNCQHTSPLTSTSCSASQINFNDFKIV